MENLIQDISCDILKKKEKSVMVYLVYTDKNNTGVIIRCDCGAEALMLSKIEDEYSKEYFLSCMLGTWYTEQDSFWHKLKERLRIVWHIIWKGSYIIQEICLPEKEFLELKEVISKYK